MKCFLIVLAIILSFGSFIDAQTNRALIDAVFRTYTTSGRKIYQTKFLKDTVAGARSSCYSFGLKIAVPKDDGDLSQFNLKLSGTPNTPPTWIGVVYNDFTNYYYMNLNTGQPYNGKFSFHDPPNTQQVNRCVKIFKNQTTNVVIDAPEQDCGLIYNFLCQDP